MSRRFNVTCRECSFTDDHAEWCQSRGYASVGPHPDAPVPDTARSPTDPNAPLEMCCGGTCVRAVCFIHGPKAQAVVTKRIADLPLIMAPRTSLEVHNAERERRILRFVTNCIWLDGTD